MLGYCVFCGEDSGVMAVFLFLEAAPELFSLDNLGINLWQVCCHFDCMGVFVFYFSSLLLGFFLILTKTGVPALAVCGEIFVLFLFILLAFSALGCRFRDGWMDG